MKQGRIENRILNTEMRLHLTQDVYVPDLLTRIRILPTVAVVGQTERVRRTDYGFVILDIYVKFLPLTRKLSDSITKLAKMVRTIPTVTSVEILKVNNREITINKKHIKL